MTDSKIVAGRDMIASIKSDGIFYPVFCAKGCSFDLKNEIIQRTGVGDGLGVKRRVRRTEFSGTASGVTVTDNDINRYSPFYLIQEAVRRAETEWEFEFTNLDNETIAIRGLFVIEGVNISGEVASLSNSTVNIIGSGLPIIGVSSPVEPGQDENVDSDWWQCTEGTYNIAGFSYEGKSLVGKEILMVSRSGMVHDIVTGAPGNMQVQSDQPNGILIFDYNNPFNSGETVWVMWKDA